MTPEHLNPDPPAELDASDIAFLKTLVSEGPKGQSLSGVLLFTGGLVYSVQCFAQLFIYDQPVPGWLHLSVAGLPTLIFLGVLFHTLWKKRRDGGEKGVAQRALNAAFTATGLTNLVLIIIFVWLAVTRRDLTFWLLYPTMVCAGQGAAWYVAFMIRKRAWLAFVSAGWFVTALSMGLFISHTKVFVSIIGVALLLLMALPGWVLMKLAEKA